MDFALVFKNSACDKIYNVQTFKAKIQVEGGDIGKSDCKSCPCTSVNTLIHLLLEE
jgi:hypothetical protein